VERTSLRGVWRRKMDGGGVKVHYDPESDVMYIVIR
jgi:hypothetical protein